MKICTLNALPRGVDDLESLAQNSALEEQKLRMDLQESWQRRKWLRSPMSAMKIRTPLTELSGSIKIAKAAKSEAQSQEPYGLSSIGQADNASGLVNDVLDLAKLDALSLETHWRKETDWRACQRFFERIPVDRRRKSR